MGKIPGILLTANNKSFLLLTGLHLLARHPLRGKPNFQVNNTDAAARGSTLWKPPSYRMEWRTQECQDKEVVYRRECKNGRESFTNSVCGWDRYGKSGGKGTQNCSEFKSGDRSGKKKDRECGDFPGGPVVKTLHFHCRGHGFDPWLGN